MPGRLASSASLPGNSPPCLLDDEPWRSVQIARAAVIAKPGPGREHRVERSLGERAKIREARKEALEIRADGRDRRLLQHDFREPDAVGIRTFAARRAPRQGAAMPIVPGQEKIAGKEEIA